MTKPLSVLGFDTSTEVLSIALSHAGQLYRVHEHCPQQQSKQLLPAIRDLMSQAGITYQDLQAIAFGQGPGSFTGVRIAASVAKTLAYASKVPLIGVSTLKILAQGQYRRSQQRGNDNALVLAGIDARMNEIYCSLYRCHQDELPHMLMPEQVTSPDHLSLPDLGLMELCGNGWPVYRDAVHLTGLSQTAQYWLQQSLPSTDENLWPDAQDLLQLAEWRYQQAVFDDPMTVLPIYLRNQVAVKKVDRKHTGC